MKLYCKSNICIYIIFNWYLKLILLIFKKFILISKYLQIDFQKHDKYLFKIQKASLLIFKISKCLFIFLLFDFKRIFCWIFFFYWICNYIESNLIPSLFRGHSRPASTSFVKSWFNRPRKLSFLRET